MDEQQHGMEMIENKFREYALFIDYEARGVFKRATPSILKCCYGFNHHGKRDKMLNRYSSDRCISCRALEDWLHVLRCPSTIKLRDKWLHTIKKQLQRKINNQVILNDAFRFVDDIYCYLNGSTNVPGSQNIIGFNLLFRGFVVKDWFGANSDETKYHQSNKIIIKHCVHLYHDCLLQRNKLMQEDKNLKQRLVEEIQRIVINYQDSERVGVQNYIRNLPSNIATRDKTSLNNWIAGFNLIQQSSEKYSPGNIRAYAQRMTQKTT